MKTVPCLVMPVRTIPALIQNAVKILIAWTQRFVILTTSVRRDAEMIQCALALMLCVIFSTPTAITAIIQQTKLDNAIQVVLMIPTVQVDQRAMVTIIV